MSSLSLKLTITMYYAVQGVFLPFLPIIFRNLNFSYWQIGILLSIGAMIVVLTQSLWGYLCDKLQTVKWLLLLQLGTSLILSLLIFRIHSFGIMLIFLSLFYVFYRPLPMLLDTLTVNYTRDNPARYGYYRMFGSLGFLLAALSSGYLLNWFGMDKGPFLITSLIGLTLLCAIPLKDAQYVCQTPKFKDFLGLATNSTILHFLLAATLLGTTQAANDNYISVYLQNLGGSPKDTGLLWTVGVATEVLAFIVIGKARLHGKSLSFLRNVALLYSLRWLLMALLTDVKLILLVQILHGICYAVFISTVQHHLAEIIPDQLRATGQGLMYMTIFGVGGVLGTMGGGLLLERFSFLYFYLTCLLFSLASFLFFQLLARKTMLQEPIDINVLN